MRFSPDWKNIAAHSQSFWINGIASILGSLALGFQYLYGVIHVDPVTFIAIMTGLNLAAMFFRLIFQKALVKEE